MEIKLNQIEFVIDELRKDANSRRAVIDVRDNKEDTYADDPACLQHIQFFIRHNKLDCSVLFRSNDLFKATYMNAFALIMLQKRVADELGIGVGTYTHRANSAHVYERDFAALEGAVKRIDAEPFEDLTYNYIGDWDEQMAAERPRILEFVEKLREEES